MARIESQAKAGYYPTPDSVCEFLKTILEFDEGARMLDPCCGTGSALAQLVPENTETFGIELDHTRATEARNRLGSVLWCDSMMEARYTHGAFSLLYLNPPYDLAYNPNGRSQRYETLFLRSFTKALQLHGILVYVIPYYILKEQDCAQAIAERFAKIQVLGFPRSEFQAFKQCIVIGSKQRISDAQAEKTTRYLMELGNLEPDDFLYETEIMRVITPVSLVVQAAQKPLVAFRTVRLDPFMEIPAIQKAGILSNLITELIPQGRNIIRPLATLEQGHLALLLAGGFMNGVIVKENKVMVIKGCVHKSSPITSAVGNDGDGGTITTRDKYHPIVKMIDVQSATIHVIQ